MTCCEHRGHHGHRHGHHHGSDCGCHHGGRHGHHRGCDCGCHSTGFRFGACFATQEEKVAWLEQYLEGLQEEAKAVEERIAKLKEEK
jgi:hypothetical protein